MSVNNRASKAGKRNRAARSSQLETTVASNAGSFISAGAVLSYDINERRCYPGQGTTVFDLTGNGRHMTLNGGATYGNGSSGGYINFDGINGCGTVPYDSGIQLNQFSILAWVYVNGTPDTYDVIFNRDYPTAGPYTTNYYLDLRGTVYQFAWYSDATPYNHRPVSSTTSPTASIGLWKMVTGTWNGTTIRIFVNGVLENTTPTGNTWDNRAHTSGITVGATSIGGVRQRYANIRVGMVALYNRGLEPNEVYANFQATRSRFGVLT